MELKDPAKYAGEPVCARCASGWPTCADTRPYGTRYTHEETCQKYHDAGWWDNYHLCEACRHELVTELEEGPSGVAEG